MYSIERKMFIMQNNKTIKQFFFYFLFIIITATGDAMAFKGNVGVNPWEAVCQTLNYMTMIKVGTLMMILNSSMILIEMILMKKIKITMLLQLILSFLIGFVVNIIVYILFGNINISSYPLNLCLGILGFIVSATGNGLLMTCDLAPFPFEGMCEQLSIKFHLDFPKTRQAFDIIFIILCLLTSLIFGYQLAIREGTIISMLIYSPIMGYVMKKAKPKMIKILQ